MPKLMMRMGGGSLGFDYEDFDVLMRDSEAIFRIEQGTGVYLEYSETRWKTAPLNPVYPETSVQGHNYALLNWSGSRLLNTVLQKFGSFHVIRQEQAPFAPKYGAPYALEVATVAEDKILTDKNSIFIDPNTSQPWTLPNLNAALKAQILVLEEIDDDIFPTDNVIGFSAAVLASPGERDGYYVHTAGQMGADHRGLTISEHIAKVAKSQIGANYSQENRMNPGKNGNGSFDCSGFTWFCYHKTGLLDGTEWKNKWWTTAVCDNLKGGDWDQIGNPDNFGNAEKGYLLGWDSGSTGINHAGVYDNGGIANGNGDMWDTANTQADLGHHSIGGQPTPASYVLFRNHRDYTKAPRDRSKVVTLSTDYDDQAEGQANETETDILTRDGGTLHLKAGGEMVMTHTTTAEDDIYEISWPINGGSSNEADVVLDAVSSSGRRIVFRAGQGVDLSLNTTPSVVTMTVIANPAG